jgi:L,D-transpeptidase ErfK/SrfK
MRAGLSTGLVVVVGLMTAPTGTGARVGSDAGVSAQTTGGPVVHEIVAGDSLASLGARYGIEPREIALANGLKPGAALPPGVTLRLDNRHVVPLVEDEVDVVINVPQRMLFLTSSEPLLGVPVGLGRRDWPTPVGAFSIVAKEENPTWDVPASIQAEMRREGHAVVEKVPPGPTNPLGAFWLGLSMGSVGVHGTNAPLSIFRHVTHGCVRLHPDDMARIYPLVPLGARGRIIYQPILLARTSEGVFLEVHPDIYRRMAGDGLSAIRESAAATGLAATIDWTAAANVLRARRGIATRIDRIHTARR